MLQKGGALIHLLGCGGHSPIQLPTPRLIATRYDIMRVDHIKCPYIESLLLIFRAPKLLIRAHILLWLGLLLEFRLQQTGGRLCDVVDVAEAILDVALHFELIIFLSVLWLLFAIQLI